MAAARPVQDKKEKLLRLIECPICLNELQDPRLLSCRHTLCYTCVRDYTEKGNYSNQLPCPVCRGVTALYQGGVDNLPKFFFMSELKEVVAEKDNEDDSKPQSQGGAVCSAEDCGQQAVKYCKDGCQFLCQQCFDTHRSFKITTNHQVIPADEGEAFTEPNNPPFPPCNRHKHQVMDLFCRTCDVPICSTCCQLNHRSHDFCELEEQAAVCKFKLSEIYEHTDGLILIVKQAIHKTKHQTKQAEADIDDTCKKVKSVFKIMHGKLNEEEKKMLLELQEARSHVKKMSDVTVDSQMMTLARLESLKSCESKLADKGSPYNYVTVTESIQRDVEDYYGQQLPGFVWSCHFVRKNGAGDGFPSGKVKIRKISEATENRGEMKEVDRIQLHNHKQDVQGLAVHNEHIYTVHYTNFIVYCFAGNGTLCSKYKHDMENKTVIQGMCLIVNGDTAMLVVSDFTNGALVWIRIDEDFTINHYDTQQLDYRPYGSYNDNGSLLVCAEDNMIHRYNHSGQPLEVIRLPEDVMPWRLTRYGDGDQYILTDYDNEQIVIVDKKGDVKTRYKDEIHGFQLGTLFDVITDTEGWILISDVTENQVLLLNQAGDEVRQLLREQHILDPSCLYLDAEHHRLYVSGCLFRPAE